MALHISPSGITCFPKVGMTFLTPSQYQKSHKMSTSNRQIFTISELLTNLSIFESLQTRPASSYCHIWTSDFQDFHNAALFQRGGEIPQGVLAAVFFGDVFQTYFHRGLLTCPGPSRPGGKRSAPASDLRRGRHRWNDNSGGPEWRRSHFHR